MPEDFQPGAAPDQWIGGPSGEGGVATGNPLSAGSITLVSKGPTTIRLSATDASGGTPGYTYQWQRSTSPTGPFVNVGDGLLTLSDSGLAAGTTYYYQLIYTDATLATDTATHSEATTTGLAKATHPIYRFAWYTERKRFKMGDTPTFAWEVTRKGGSTVDPPSDAIVHIRKPDGTVETQTPDEQSDTAVAQAVFAYDYTPSVAGEYYVWLTLVYDTYRISSTEQWIKVEA